MKRMIIMLVVVLFSVTIVSTNIAKAEEYHLGAGDVLTIGVWGYEDLQLKDVVVRPDGNIAFPIVGEIKVTGSSVAELTNVLTRSLADYVINPKVTVNIYKFHSTRVYVLGEVVKPGMYEIEKEHKILDAIGVAGGYTKNAAKKKVLLLRKDDREKPITVNLLNLLNNGDMSQNYTLGEGDVVYLTDSGKLNFATDILPWISATYQVVRMND